MRNKILQFFVTGFFAFWIMGCQQGLVGEVKNDEIHMTNSNCPYFVRLEIINVGHDLQAILRFINISAETAFVLKPFWGEDKPDGYEFRITVNDKEVPYIGPAFKRAEPTIDDYVKLLPGDNYLRKISLEQYYEFLPGEHTYEITYSVLTINPITKAFFKCESSTVMVRYRLPS